MRAGVDFHPALRGVAAHEGGAAHVGNLRHGFAGSDAVRDFDNGAFGIAVQQQVGGGIHQDRGAHFFLPVIEVRNAAQRGFDPADNDRHVGEGFAAAVRINQRGAVGAFACQPAGGVSVVGARFAVGGVAVDHRVHIARRHAEEQVGCAQCHERVFGMPVRLRNDADAETLRFQHPPDHRHAERRVVYVSVAGDDNNVAGIPAQRVHFRTTGGEIRRGVVAFRPVFGVVEQGDRYVGIGVGQHGVGFSQGESGYSNPVCAVRVVCLFLVWGKQLTPCFGKLQQTFIGSGVSNNGRWVWM